MVPGDSPHLQEDLSELGADLQQGVQVARLGGHTEGLKVIRLEGLLLPAPAKRGGGESE